MNSKRTQKGFTIIEVVLVLAIAGLIFLMVFIALPALQRNTRDSQRKQDLSRLQTALSNYTGNNRGSLPTASGWNTFVSTYLTVSGDSFVDPSGPTSTQTGLTTYALTASTTTPLTSTFANSQNVIYYSVGFVCDTADSSAITAGGSRKVAFRMALEGGGIVCVNN